MEKLENKGNNFNKEVLRSLLLSFLDSYQYDETKINELIKNHPREYKFYGEKILPLKEEFIHGDLPLQKNSEVYRIFNELSLVNELERKWAISHIPENLRNELSRELKDYYDLLCNKLNLKNDKLFNDHLELSELEFKDEKIIEKNPDILEENVYKYLSGKLSKKEWEDYVNYFIDNPIELAILKEIEDNFDTIKNNSEKYAKVLSETTNQGYNELYEKFVRQFIKSQHIKLIDKYA